MTISSTSDSRFSADLVTWICVASKVAEENFELFPVLGSFASDNLKIEGAKQAPYSDQPTEAMQKDTAHFTLYSKGQEVSSIGQLFVRQTFSKLPFFQASYFHDLRIIAYFSHTKRLKVPYCTRPTAQGLYCRIIPVTACCSGMAKGVPLSTCRGVYLRRLTEGGTPNLPMFSTVGNACASLRC